ncbi:MAG: glucoamylase family protein [Bacteroidota bacterium]
MKKILILLLFTAPMVISGQTYLFFQDSPNAEYYDFSWLDKTAPSELEGAMEPEFRKFPVESVIPAQQGINSLRLKWRSLSGGNWLAIAAGDGWTAKDVSDTDTMAFWLQSVEGISALHLPRVFLEDITNQKGVSIPLSDWSADLIAGEWTRIVIPMELYLTSGDGVDYTNIKTIGFTQGEADSTEHTLLVDNMRVKKGDVITLPASIPQGVSVKGYEYHMEIRWDPNPETYLMGYEIERSLDGGLNYSAISQVGKSATAYTDWVRPLGEAVVASYRVKALNEVNEPSEPSEEAGDTTHSMTDEALLDMVQLYTFRYFWDFAHEASGMTRERNTSGNIVTTGGSGFGMMAIPVGIERGFITREEGVARSLKILNSLSTADRFHGAWSHWINGNTGEVVPFGTKDNGGDLVETAYVAQGLLTIRQYFDGTSPDEQQIVQMATTLWEGIEWDWYRQNDSPALYWHWSPNYNWEMNMTVRGWNEAAITYLMAIASPTHGVPASLWKSGWAGMPYYTNGKRFYGYELPVGPDYGGPLFFAHYSFVGFDPRDKADSYANYFEQNRNHSLVHQAYCEANPRGFAGYSASCWGLTASDDPDGYMAHEPTPDRDNGTITPTAALSSFPYTPDESMLALKHFYRELGERTWGWMGFYDAFNQQRNWWANSYLAIDQGPIILMIENHRSEMLWDLFMSNPEIQPMVDAIFNDNSNPGKEMVNKSLSLFPNPASGDFQLIFNTMAPSKVQLDLYSMTGQHTAQVVNRVKYDAGEHQIKIDTGGMVPGLYLARLVLNEEEAGTIRLMIK